MNWMETIVGDWGVSPDGSTIAIAVHDPANPGIRLIRFATPGSAAQITDIPVRGFGNIRGTSWAPDSRGFYVQTAMDRGHALLYVDRSGTIKLLRKTDFVTWGVPSRDGKKLAFVDLSPYTNIWMAQTGTQP